MFGQNFMEMLKEQWARGNFVCVGLDSEFGKIPESLRWNQFWKERKDVSNVIVEFNHAIVEATKDIVCAYKPNAAFYEAHGDQGIAALHRTIVDIRDIAPHVPVIFDAKRADIGNTNAGYVKMAFDFLRADAITVHPYLGAEALKPFLDQADKGIFVLCRTSNSGSDELQNLPITLSFSELTELVGDRNEAYALNGLIGWGDPVASYHIPFYQYVALRVSRHWNKNGNCGLVVGATYPDELRIVRKLVSDMPILIPGIGAQGGDLGETVTAGQDSRNQGMIINSSRGIIFSDNPRRETKRLSDDINMHRLEVKI